MRIKDTIFSLFDFTDSTDDLYQESGKGFEQRFQELLAGDLDDHELESLTDFVQNLIVPATMQSDFLLSRQEEKGIAIGLSGQLVVNRRTIQYAHRIFRIRGTKRSYQLLLKLIGVENSDVIIHPGASGWDSGTLDSRRLDSGCSDCLEYTLTLMGVNQTPELDRAIEKIVEFCEPANAKLRAVVFLQQPSGAPYESGGLDDPLTGHPTLDVGGLDSVNTTATYQTGN